jgi:hypothetical protein
LPKDAHVYLIGDREFHGQDMLELIQEQHWIPVIRSKGNLGVELEDGTRCRMAELAPQAGRRSFYQRVWLTGWAWGPYSCRCLMLPKPSAGRKPKTPGTSSVPSQPRRTS